MTLIADSAIDTLWYTRCPVPTASGLANSLGWLDRTANESGVRFGVLQDAGPELAVRHFDHHLSGLIREGGNVPALAARASGSPTRLIGLTWIDEAQAILVRGDSDIREAGLLAGARIGIPAWAADQARSFPRAMALHGFASALRLGELSFADVTLVEVATTAAPEVRTASSTRNTTWGVESLLRGDVDAIYVKAPEPRKLPANTVSRWPSISIPLHPCVIASTTAPHDRSQFTPIYSNSARTSSWVSLPRA